MTDIVVLYEDIKGAGGRKYRDECARLLSPHTDAQEFINLANANDHQSPPDQDPPGLTLFSISKIGHWADIRLPRILRPLVVQFAKLGSALTASRDQRRAATWVKSSTAAQTLLVSGGFPCSGPTRIMAQTLSDHGKPFILSIMTTPPPGPFAPDDVGVLDLPQAIVVNSVAAQNALQNELGVEPEKILLWPNTADDIPVTPEHPESNSRTRFVFVGRLEQQKGVQELVEAFLRIPASVPARLVLVGDGPLERPIRKNAADAIRSGRLELSGQIPDVQSILHESDVFVLPSRQEGRPYALLEAMSNHLPSIVTDVGDMKRMVDDAGIVIPPKDVDSLSAALMRMTDADARAEIKTKVPNARQRDSDWAAEARNSTRIQVSKWTTPAERLPP